MYSPGLSSADLKTYFARIAGSHALRVEILLMDLNHNVVADLTDRLLDGQVSADNKAEVSRSASLSLFDPDRQVPLDSNNPTDGALFPDRMVQVRYGTYNPDDGLGWVYAPIFTGPIDSMSRTDATIDLDLLGKDELARRAAWRTKSYPIGSYRRNVILDLMREVGETRFALDDWSLKTANPYGLTAETDVWALAKRMGAGRLFFYDGAGRLVLRPWMTRPIYTFKTGPGGTILTYPAATYDMTDVKNVVRVKGAEGVKPGTAYAPASHPLSAQSLGRNGKARHLVEIIEDGDLKTHQDCLDLANSRLKVLLLGSLQVTFDAIPNPLLELGDVVTVQTPEFGFTFAVDSFSIPLTAGGAMSVGYLQRRSVKKNPIRRKR